MRVIFPCPYAVYMYKIMILLNTFASEISRPIISIKFLVDPTVEKGLRVCSDGHTPLTVMPIYGKIMIIKKTHSSSSKASIAQMIIFSLVATTGLEKCCITSAYLQWLFQSGERLLTCGPLVSFNLYHSLGIFSRWQIVNIFLLFPENRLWHFMLIVFKEDILHEMSKPIFWTKKIRKIFQNFMCWLLFLNYLICFFILFQDCTFFTRKEILRFVD